MARAKQTARSEARRRYRLAQAPAAIEGEGDEVDPASERRDRAPERPAQQRAGGDARPGARPGFAAAFRAAYHPANIREDLRTLPATLRTRAFVFAVLLVLAGGVTWFAYPLYTGSVTAWELLVLPGSALAPQLVAGFLAPRASYLLGAGVGLIQPIVYLVVNTSERVQAAYLVRGLELAAVTPEELGLAFFNSVVMGSLFAAMSAWYRRFLSLSSARRAQAGRSSSSRGSSGAKGNPSRRPASR